MEAKEVRRSFSSLIKSLEKTIADFSEYSAELYKKENYEQARAARGRIREIKKVKDEIEKQQEQWEKIWNPDSSDAPLQPVRKGKKKKPLPRGLQTPEKEFKLPILQAVEELGGSAAVNEVLQKVFEIMKPRLNSYDLQPIPSHPDRFRWENTSMWCRQRLVEEGLLASQSRRGVWVITEKGRTLLEKERMKKNAPTLFDPEGD